MKDSIELYYKEGSSDKVYKATVEESGAGYIVNFAYGRRGNALTTGCKTPKPVAYEAAKKVFDKLVIEKTGKGYIPDPSGKPYEGTSTEARDTGFRPQLLNEIEEEDLEYYINNPDYCAQEKYDGRRRSLVIDDRTITGTNRKGLSVAIEKDLEREVLTNRPPELNKYVLDGEALGDVLMLFDIPSVDSPYKERYQLLKLMYKFNTPILMRPVSTAWTTKEKRALFNKLKKDNAEGIVFKNIHSKYKPGRPASGGDQLKFKFVATATCMVVKVNDIKRSVQLAVFDEQCRKTEVGNVTVYPNQDIPKEGAFVEVKYLYYFQGGSLFQPVLLGERDDVSLEDCTLKQLKIKREEIES